MEQLQPVMPVVLPWVNQTDAGMKPEPLPQTVSPGTMELGDNGWLADVDLGTLSSRRRMTASKDRGGTLHYPAPTATDDGRNEQKMDTETNTIEVLNGTDKDLEHLPNKPADQSQDAYFACYPSTSGKSKEVIQSTIDKIILHHLAWLKKMGSSQDLITDSFENENVPGRSSNPLQHQSLGLEIAKTGDPHIVPANICHRLPTIMERIRKNDFVSALFELLSPERPDFDVVSESEEGLPPRTVFTTEVRFMNSNAIQHAHVGKGGNKKTSKTSAAVQALTHILGPEVYNELLVRSRVPKGTISSLKWAKKYEDKKDKQIKSHHLKMELNEKTGQLSSKFRQHVDTLAELCVKQNLDFDAQLKYLVESTTLTSTDVATQGAIILELSSILKPTYPDCVIHPCGSFVTGLAGKDSDLDVYIDLFGDSTDASSKQNYSASSIREAKKKAVDSVSVILEANSEIYRQVQRITSSRVPIIKVNHRSGLQCDIAFSNLICLQNSRLVKFYQTLDPRVKYLMLLVRYWAKYNNLSGSLRIKNYTLTIMVLVYLTRRRIVPSVHTLQTISDDGQLEQSKENFDQNGQHFVGNKYNNFKYGWNIGFNNNCQFVKDFMLRQVAVTDNLQCEISKTTGLPTTHSIVNMLEEFFKIYATFDYKETMISALRAEFLPKANFAPGHEVELSAAFEFDKKCIQGIQRHGGHCVEDLQRPFYLQDPFELDYNIGGSVDLRTLNDFKWYCEDGLKRIRLVQAEFHPNLFNIFIRNKDLDSKLQNIENPSPHVADAVTKLDTSRNICIQFCVSPDEKFNTYTVFKRFNILEMFHVIDLSHLYSLWSIFIKDFLPDIFTRGFKLKIVTNGRTTQMEETSSSSSVLIDADLRMNVSCNSENPEGAFSHLEIGSTNTNSSISTPKTKGESSNVPAALKTFDMNIDNDDFDKENSIQINQPLTCKRAKTNLSNENMDKLIGNTSECCPSPVVKGTRFQDFNAENSTHLNCRISRNRKLMDKFDQIPSLEHSVETIGFVVQGEAQYIELRQQTSNAFTNSIRLAETRTEIGLDPVVFEEDISKLAMEDFEQFLPGDLPARPFQFEVTGTLKMKDMTLKMKNKSNIIVPEFIIELSCSSSPIEDWLLYLEERFKSLIPLYINYRLNDWMSQF